MNARSETVSRTTDHVQESCDVSNSGSLVGKLGLPSTDKTSHATMAFYFVLYFREISMVRSGPVLFQSSLVYHACVRAFINHHLVKVSWQVVDKCIHPWSIHFTSPLRDKPYWVVILNGKYLIFFIPFLQLYTR